MKKIIIGTGGESLDLSVLLTTRLLIQANSGGGKSYLIRRIVEQMFGKVQVIVIDPEGDFATLREKFDFLLVGKDGDTPADVRSAGLLAQKLLELNASAICDLYEMRPHDRHVWVQLFIQALINAPKKLWHSVVIIVDEIQLFAPEKGQGESIATDAIIDLATRGRKRGMCLVGATLRLGRLSKNVAAELQNVLIGSTMMDIDRKRASDTLGILKSDEKKFFQDLRMLEPGNFYALGRAISREMIQFKVAAVSTTHPEAGGSRKVSAPPPSDKVKALLPQLSDLPAAAEEKQKTERELRAEIVELKRQVKAVPVAKSEVKEVLVIPPAQVKAMDKYYSQLIMAADDVSAVLRKKSDEWAMLRLDAGKILEAIRKLPPFGQRVVEKSKLLKPDISEKIVVRMPMASATAFVNGKLPIGERKVLEACIQFEAGLERNQLTVLTGYKRSSRDAYIARLKEKGYVETPDGKVIVTTDGIAALPDAQRLPTGMALRIYWTERLPLGEKAILEVLLQHYPQAVHRDVLETATGYKRSSRDAYLSRLAAKNLVIDAGRGYVKASEGLFG